MGLPSPYTSSPPSRSTQVPTWVSYLPLLLLLPLVPNPITTLFPPAPPSFISHGLAQCGELALTSPAELGSKRTVSDRFVKGTKPVLLVNGTIWTANDGDEHGQEILYGGSVLLEDGLIKAVGRSKKEVLGLWKQGKGGKAGEVEEIELGGKWVTPGIVDMHSHLGVGSSPGLEGSEDTNSVKAPILPFLRSLDGLNTHDASYNLSIAGGITTALILPGSANNIGGQAFVIKPRQTEANTPSSMVVENPFVIGDKGGIVRTGYNRHMKHACGENIHRVYNDNRFDQAYNFRKAYTSATQLRNKQDEWCAVGKANKEPFPEDLEWEALADVLRGKVKVNVHCYETVDFDQLVRLTNEFKFPLAAVHHAHEAYLVPDLLKKAYGNVPTAAIFATNKNYKREASRGSEFAPKILAEAGIKVAMKSDHPVLDSRYLVFEAAQANHYGLNTSLALASVTSTPANALGMGHRMGYLRESYDADVVVWDSHPLALGATPTHVFIDGISQLAHAHANPAKPASYQVAPSPPSFGDEAEIHEQSRGDPPYADLISKKVVDEVIFTNVRHVYLSDAETGEVQETANVETVVVRGGKIVCTGKECLSASSTTSEVVDLKGGDILPGLTSYGGPLGLTEIVQESSTQDGKVLDNIAFDTAPILRDELILAADGASFGTKDALLAAKFGVTKAVTAPNGKFIKGLGFAFSPRAASPLSPGAILQEVTAVHLSIGHEGPRSSVSTQIATLRKLLQGKTRDEGGWWKKVAAGDLPVVVTTHKADIIARLIVLKKEIEHESGNKIQLTIAGGAEAHLLANELASASVGVILTPSRSFPTDWDRKRILAGPPLTAQTPVEALVSAGVLVGLGIDEQWSARNTRFDVGWTLLGSPSLTPASALALVTTNLEKLLGLKTDSDAKARDWIAVEGGDAFGFNGKVVATGGAGGDGEGVALF